MIISLWGGGGAFCPGGFCPVPNINTLLVKIKLICTHYEKQTRKASHMLSLLPVSKANGCRRSS